MSKTVSGRITDELFNKFKNLVGRKGTSASKVIEEIIEEELIEEELGIDPVTLHKAHTKLKGDFIKCGKIITKQIEDIKSLEEELKYSKELLADLKERLSIVEQSNYEYEQEVDSLEDELEYSKELIDDLEKNLSIAGQSNYEYHQMVKDITDKRTKIEQRLVENLNDIERLKKGSTKDLYKLCGFFGVLVLLIFVILL